MTQVYKHRDYLTPQDAAKCCAPVDDLLKAEFFKSLSDPTRLKLLACLAKCGRPCSVTEIAECCEVDFSVVSRHLAILCKAGVISSVKEGRKVFYSVRYQHLSRIFKALAKSIGECQSKRIVARKRIQNAK